MGFDSGEAIYADRFQFLGTVPPRQQEVLRDYLYKVSFNLTDAYLFFEIIRFLDETDRSDDAYDAQGTTFRMAVTSFSVAFRRVTDKSSKRNIRGLIKLVDLAPIREERLKKIDEIYSKYSKFVDQIIVHQDRGRITKTPKIPDYEQNIKDLDAVTAIYDEIAKRFCWRYIKVRKKHPEDIASFKKTFLAEEIQRQKRLGERG